MIGLLPHQVMHLRQPWILLANLLKSHTLGNVFVHRVFFVTSIFLDVYLYTQIFI